MQHSEELKNRPNYFHDTSNFSKLQKKNLNRIITGLKIVKKINWNQTMHGTLKFTPDGLVCSLFFLKQTNFLKRE